jgi:hypothetical protein
MTTLDTLRILRAGPVDVTTILGLIRALAGCEHLSDVYEQAGARRLDDWATYRLTGDSLTRLASEAH